MNREDLAATVASLATLHGEFTLRSGASASEYFDKYRFESDPSVLRSIAEHLALMVPRDTEILAGLELGGVPIATALALQTGLRAVFVRKRAKTYGTCQVVEGADITGRQVLIIEDVVTSGGQVVASANDIRALGGVVAHALCVVDRHSGGTAALSAVGITLRSLFSKEELLAAAPSSD